MLGMGLPLEQGYWDSVLELWLAARLHRKRYTSPRHRLCITRHLLLFMSRQRPYTSGRYTMAIRTIEATAVNDLRQRG
jgi:hypothetical protein